ncbi:MAG: accessory gene regulator B family protein [Lachnospiraceae bacterium]|nr:accessory gene regulator B family protein [Lachnospiraceae bacterium]
MVEKSARLITDSIIAEGLIAENLRDWYVYSFTRILEMAINVGTILLLSIIFQNTVPTILFLLFFNTLRKRTGGFHCNEFWQCYIVTNMLYVLISLSEKIIVMHGVILCIATAISAAVIFVVGTVNHPNIYFDKVELRRSKALARSILAIELLVLIFMGAIRIDRVYIYYMSVSIILCAVLILLAKVFRQEVKEDENKKNN